MIKSNIIMQKYF